MGRKLVSQMTPEELERVRAKKREEYAKYREKNKEKEQERQRKSSASYRKSNEEKVRERDRERKRNCDRERVNMQQRERYSRDIGAAFKQSERRRIREPQRLIRAAAKLFRDGIIEFGELDKRINEALTHADKAFAKEWLRSKTSKHLGDISGEEQL